MKYIIFKHKSEMFMPVIIPQHVTHSMVKIEDCIPVSAGFFKIDSNFYVTTFGISESLNLVPEKRDVELLRKTLLNFGMYAFM